MLKASVWFLFCWFSFTGMAQENSVESHQSDSLVWSIYIPGKSDMSDRPYAEQVAQLWGIKLFYFFGDCTGTYDEKRTEFEQSNQAVFRFLTETYGEDWRIKFDQQVAALRKKNP